MFTLPSKHLFYNPSQPFKEEGNTSLPEIKMEGRSGCKLEVIKSGQHVIIKKYSSSVAYNQRLIKQAHKQKLFYNSLHENYPFSTAKVIETYSSEKELAWFSMPYLFSEKYSDYLEKASITDLKKLLNDILDYFRFNIKNSKTETIKFDIIEVKIKELEVRIALNDHVDNTFYCTHVFPYLKESTPNKPLPLGRCHGDFTFSNILFSDNKIFLLDFLDSFIESPLIDIVKLRQDTCFKWSIMLEKEMPLHKKNKLLQSFDYLDKEIASFCSGELGMGEWYNYLQVFNLVRILPYLDDPSEILFIEKSLRPILK